MLVNRLIKMRKVNQICLFGKCNTIYNAIYIRYSALEVVVVPDTEPLPRPDYSTAELNELVAAIKRTIILRDLGEHHWTDENTEVVKSWLCTTSHELISFYFVDGKLSASLSYPEMHVDDCFYFIRDSNNVFTMDNFHDDVTFGYNDQDVTGHMLTVMEHIYAPYFLCKSNATDAPRGHFRQALYLFLARLTEFHHKLSGSTFLYVPSEVHTLSTEEAASDSQLVNRLELVAEHWIFQLRLTLNDKEPVTPYKLQWPNDEYEFWNYRCKWTFPFDSFFIRLIRLSIFRFQVMSLRD